MHSFKYSLLVVALLLGMIPDVFSSPPGYLGKRLGFKYGLLTSPAFRETYTTGEDEIFLNMTHEIESEWVVGRKMSLALFYQFSRTRVANNSEFMDYSAHKEIYGNDSYFGIYNHFIGLRMRKYNSDAGNLAPLGKYWFLETKFNNSLIVDHQLNDKVKYAKSLSFGFGYGNQRILFDKLMLNAEISVIYLPVNIFQPKIETQRETYIRKEAMKRVRGMIGLNLKIGFGWLPRF